MVTIPKLIEVKASSPYKLWLKYANGESGEVDLSKWSGQGIFNKWDDTKYFSKVFIPEDHNAVAWDDELELCPNALYLEMIGKKYEEYATHQ